MSFKSVCSMRCGKVLLGVFVLGLLPAAGSAQAPTLKFLSKTGDPVVGLGSLESMSSVQINNSGMWTNLVDTTWGNPDSDGCLLRNGFVTLREGSLLMGTVTTTLVTFKYQHLTSNGDLALILTVRRPNGSLDGVYWNTVPVANRFGFVNAPEVPATSTWQAFNVVKMNDSRTMLLVGQIDNTSVGGSGSR